MNTVVYWTAHISALLEELGINTNLHDVHGGCDITLLYSLDGHCFTGVAQVSEDFVSIEFWLGNYTQSLEALTKRLDEINVNPQMIEDGVRWMRFLFSKNHLGFVAQLSVSGQQLSASLIESRLQRLVQLMKIELSTLTSL